jgi:internalin A
MTPEEAYEEALSRISEAEKTGAVELNLSGLLELTRLPSELERLTSLERLDLSWCFCLNDLQPLTKLTRLQTLEVADLIDPSSLASLTSLQTLRSSYCALDDLSPLASLTSLQTLDISSCSRLGGDLSPLADLSALKTLRLCECENLSGDLHPLEKLTELQTLHLGNCHQLRVDLSLLAKLTKLQTLCLSGYFELMGDLSPLSNLTALQTLDLDGCYQLEDLSPLVNLTGLQMLRLWPCERLINLSPLGRLTALQKLTVFGAGELRDLSPLAGLTGLQSLSLSNCNEIQDLSLLAGLSELQTLDLSQCLRISNLAPVNRLLALQTLRLTQCEPLQDLAPLAGLISLQKLDLSHCRQLRDLSPLAGLTALQTLSLSRCSGLRQFAPLKPLLPTLKNITLFACVFDDLPSEICGEKWDENVLNKVRAHYKDLKAGRRIDAEVKVLFLGNGGVGKTQLCRRLRDLEFDPSVPTTHGIQLRQTTAELDGFPEPVRLNLWDFGGQDIYHGSHALFLHGQAVFLMLWTPELERTSSYEENGVTLRHRPLSYWLDYIRNFAGKEASVLIVQSQCDTRDKRVLHPPAPVDDFPFHRFIEVSARTGLNLGTLKEHIRESVRDCFERRPPAPIGAGRLKVRDRLRQMLEEDQKRESAQRQHRLLERAQFERLCDDLGGISDKEAMLDFLHHNGVVFYRAGLFGDRIVLDQNWALEAIYALFDRKKIQPLLRGYGRFSRADLQALIWSDYTPEEQKVFLGMMESCGICFKVRELSDGEWEYIAPELLPEWSEAQKSLLAGRIPKGQSIAEAEAIYTFLHEGVLRGYLSKIGRQAGDAALYWKYGCWSYEETTDSRVLIESQWDDAESEAGAGSIRLRAWGQNAESLIHPLLEALESMPIGQRPKIKRTKAIALHATVRASASITARLVSAPPVAEPSETVRQDGSKQLDRPTQIKLEDLIFARDPIMKDFFVSYTKADQPWAEWIAWKLEEAGYSTVIQVWDFRPGANFVLEMQNAATIANRTIAVLSPKYLESSFTQPEWAAAFAQDPQGKKQKLIPIRVAPCELTGLLASIVYLDLVGLPENDARAALLAAVWTSATPPNGVRSADIAGQAAAV